MLHVWIDHSPGWKDKQNQTKTNKQKSNKNEQIKSNKNEQYQQQ